ncbi:LicD family protein [Xenorhabdus bovienii]|uniref:LicD family protein n=1 Tax=Xenorhabdus bovienii TaxID=40576 RepID=UPI00237D103F|nr:LicD family protein [Xenorhabdus bovienii]MDE1493761.1 LicD family protein [Xenorhabdus bovienii]MDE9471749.1 LicD family protein [Xenorhabdus bovienii]
MKKIIKNLFPFLLHIKNKFYTIKRRKLLSKCKDDLLDSLELLSKKININYWLEYGTMLGAVRENKIIAHDYDLDIGILESDWSFAIRNELKKLNIKLIREIKIDNKTIEETYLFKGILFDIFYCELDNNILKTPVFRPFSGSNWLESINMYGGIELYYFDNNFTGFSQVQLENKNMKIPKNYHSHLCSYYGDNYMTPIPNWKGNNAAYSTNKLGIEINLN